MKTYRHSQNPDKHWPPAHSVTDDSNNKNSIKKKTKNDMNHANCIITTCKKYDTCSHAIIYGLNDGSNEQLVIVNPKSLQVDDDGRCQHYCEPETIKVAHGFAKMCRNIPNAMYHEFTAAMISHYNRTDFYDMRNGKKPISPERQQTILKILKNIGFDIPANPWDKITEEVKYFD